jgi:hypothetical protein
MTRAEAEALLVLAERRWLVGERRGRAYRIASVLEEWAGEHGFDDDPPALFKRPESERSAS